jgi:outer membrane autotransporter protein
LRAALLASTALALASALPAAGPAHAQDATWLANPGSADINTGSNWASGSVPTGTAFFDTSATTALTLNSAATFGGWTFNAGASNYTFTAAFPADLRFTGTGIVVNGGSAAITNGGAGVMLFYNSSTAGSASITSHGSINFFDTSSAGSAAITNTYSMLFNDSSTAANATINNSFGLTFGQTSTAGSATITNAASGLLIFNGTSSAGGATITNNSGGDLNFYDASTADHAVITNIGNLRFDGTSTAASATIINNNALAFFGNSTADGATITNNNNLYFYGSSTAGNTAIINSNYLSFNNASTAGSATIANNNNLYFYDTSTAGSATVTNNNGGILNFYNTSTAGNATITNNAGGTIEFYDNSTAGSASITNNNELTFYSNTTAGSAQLINSGSSAVVNFWTPGPSSDGRITAGSLAGSGRFDLNSVELTVGSNNLSTEVTGVLTGDGLTTGTSLIKTGTGTLTLSGTNTYTGATIINDGALVVNGSIAASSSLTMDSGTTLGGTGTVGATTIASGGTLAPGNSIGTLTVNGNLTFNSGGVYAVEISPTAADRTNVTGTATLTGATVQAIALPGSFRQQTYTILNATGGLGGTQFAGLTLTGSSISPGARNPHLTYDTNNVFLVLDPGTIQLPSGASGNQSSVAGGINSAVLNGGTPPAAFDTLLNMTGAQQTNALNQVSGQPATGGATGGTQMTTSFMTLLLNPNGGSVGGTTFGGARSFASEPALSPEAAEAYAAVTPKDKKLAVPAEPRWSVWGQVYGGYNKTEGDSADTTARTWGLATGFDYRVAPDLTLGFALAGGSMNWSLSEGLGCGKSDVLQLGAYGRKEFGPAYLSTALSYAWHNMSTDRTVTVSGTDKLTASFAAHSFGGRIETGTRFATPWVGITPYAALQVQNFRTPSYSESAVSGSNAFALTYDATSTTTTRTELGAWFDNTIALDRGNVLALRSRAAWANDHSNNPATGAVFQTLPDSNFTVNGAQAAENSLLTSLGAELRLASNWSVGARFDGEFASGSQSYAGTGTVRYAW